MDPLDTVFRNLDRWRHLPSYQLERRADIFFSVYLRDVVEEFTGVALTDEILPELPLKRDLIWPELPTNNSVKVDYALFAKDGSRVFFVELKTDAESLNDKQDEYLEAAQGLGFKKIVECIRAILLTTNAHQKYHHLAVVLERLGYLTLPPDLASYIYPTPRAGLSSRLERITVAATESPVEVLYLMPQAEPGRRCIDFSRFAEHVDRFSDPLSRMFSQHLRAWIEEAGARAPR